MTHSPGVNLSRTFLSVLLVSVSAGLTALAYPGWGCAAMVWFGPAVLLVRLPDFRPGAAFLWGYLWGCLLHVALIYWLFDVTPTGTVLLILAYSAWPGLAFWSMRRFLSTWPRAGWLLGPPIWGVMEYLMAVPPVFAFPWCLLGNTQTGNLPLLQLASVTGVFGISFLIMAVNVGMAFWVREVLAAERRLLGWPLILSAVLVLGVLAVHLGGTWRLGELAEERPVSVALLQGNYDHLTKWSGTDKSVQDILNTYERLGIAAGASGPDLVVWPETAVPLTLEESPQVQERVESMVRRASAFSLVGTLRVAPGDTSGAEMNSVLLYGPDGRSAGQDYAKRLLVPFGEYNPFPRLLWFVDPVSAGGSVFQPGERSTVFEVPSRDGRMIRFGVLICFEAMFPQMAREHVVHGAGLLVSVTNDAWFGRTSMPHQHAAMAVVRAVESGVHLVRAANTGITLWADPWGRVRRVLRRGEETLFVEGYLMTEPGIVPRGTFYARYGDWFSLCCVGVVLMSGLLACMRWVGRSGSPGPERVSLGCSRKNGKIPLN